MEDRTDNLTREQAEAELREKAAQLRVLLESSHAGIIMVDPTGRITMANRRMADMFGYSLDEVIGSSYTSSCAS